MKSRLNFTLGSIWYRGLCVSALGFISCAVPTGYVPSGFVPDSELAAARLVNRSVSYFSRSRFGEAEVGFLRASMLEPDSRAIRHSLALTHFRMGAFKEAEESIRKLLSSSADEEEQINLHFEMGSIYSAQGEYEKSLAFLEIALRKAESLLEPEEAEVPEEDSFEPATMLVSDVESETEPALKKIVILEALLEVSLRNGDVQRARCYAHEVVNELIAEKPIVYADFTHVIRVLTGLGYAREALGITETYIPGIVVKRNAALAHAKSLAFLGMGEINAFIEWQAFAQVAYDSDEQTLKELRLVERLFTDEDDSPNFEGKSLGDDALLVEREQEYWPPVLRELLVGLLQSSDTESAELDIFPNRLEIGSKLDAAKEAALE